MSKPEDTWKHIAEIEAATPTPEEDTLTTQLKKYARHYYLYHNSTVFNQLDEKALAEATTALKAQRQSDLEKLSFHLGIDLKTLQGYLDSSINPTQQTK